MPAVSITLGGFLRRLKKAMAAESLAVLSERELVERFLSGHDEAAFQAILSRHGPMVFRVCRRVLSQEQDVEDAFQATFLVLAREAHKIRKQGSLASWLHGVAYRAALKARAGAARRRTCEARIKGPPPAAALPDEVSWKELRSLLDEELTRLPAKLRAPLVLCYLEGLTQDEAAAQLGCSKITCRRLLERARALLGSRLARRGVTLSAVLFALLLSECAADGAVPPALLAFTANVIPEVLAGKCAAAAGLSARAVALADGLLRSGLAAKWRPLAALLLAALVAGIGGADVTRREQPVAPSSHSATEENNAPSAAANPAPERAEERPGAAGGVAFRNPSLILAPEIPRELNLSAEQKGKIDEVVREADLQNQEAFELLAQSRGRRSPDRGPLVPGMQLPEQPLWTRIEGTRCQALRKALPDILTPEQARRFYQLQLHAAGLLAFFNPDVEKALALTDEQKARIRAIGLDTQPEDLEVGAAGVRNNPFRYPFLRQQRRIPRVLDVLDPDQRKTWFDLLGSDPFHGDVDMQFRWAYGLGFMPSRPLPVTVRGANSMQILFRP
jgi:RNA polymerase sigma factor (sigma-70 family)